MKLFDSPKGSRDVGEALPQKPYLPFTGTQLLGTHSGLVPHPAQVFHLYHALLPPSWNVLLVS